MASKSSLLIAAAGLIVAAAVAFIPPQSGEPAATTWLPAEPDVDFILMPGWDEGPAITAQAAALIELNTGTVLYAKNPRAPWAPASTTKVLTGLVALEIANDLDEIVTVSRRAASTRGSSAHLVAGQKIRMRDLLYGLLLRSGNDAAVAIAEHLGGGSEAAFMELMNQRAKELGAAETHFVNPHGLDAPGHMTTALDLAILTRAALLHPDFAEIVASREYTPDGSGVWQNTNRLLWRLEGAVGVKTGTTGQAGYCLVAAVSRNGMRLLSVVLGSGNRWNDSTVLLEHGFRNFHLVNMANQGEAVAALPLGGSPDGLGVVAAQPLRAVVRDQDVSRVQARIELETIEAADPALRPPGHVQTAARRGDPL